MSRWLLVPLFVLATALPSFAAEPVHIYVVRHAERAPGKDDPSLSEAGQERAAQLAFVLQDSGIELILSSDYRRTKETAAAVAKELGIPVEVYDPRDLPGLAALLAARGMNALVVGHSNTTPATVEALGGEPGSPIDDATEFDRLYLVTTDFEGTVQSVLLHYGQR